MRPLVDNTETNTDAARRAALKKKLDQEVVDVVEEYLDSLAA